mgnify:CR=1 FL=1
MQFLFRQFSTTCLIIIFLTACTSSQAEKDDVVVTLIFTNDMESAYEPVPAWWRDDIEQIGGIAELSTLINNIRNKEPNVFLFDAGDIFTGALSRLTGGALMFEFMITMGYDAMGIGNHEFDYGEASLAWQKNRVPFPVLGANLFYKDTEHPFAQPHAIIERGGIRIGVIGTIGIDAARTAQAVWATDELDVIDPAKVVQRSVDELRDNVDLIVLLTHQGHTAPMQTDAEADPRLARDINKDIALADAVDGVDVLFGGHADAGTWEPVVSPRTGTLIMQTFGQATYLGFLQLTLDGMTGEIKSSDGKLVPVDSNALEPDPIIERKYNSYRNAFPELTEVVGQTEHRLNRKYFDESSLANLLNDIQTEMTNTDIGLINSGGIRKDLPRGDVEIVDILDVLPFVDPVVVVEMTGEQLRAIMEQGFTLLRGLMQVSGIEVAYDLSRPEGQRIISLKRNGSEIKSGDVFEVTTSRFLANGGDHYDTFTETVRLREYPPLDKLVIDYFKKHGTVPKPSTGRLIDLTKNQQ